MNEDCECNSVIVEEQRALEPVESLTCAIIKAPRGSGVHLTKSRTDTLMLICPGNVVYNYPLRRYSRKTYDTGKKRRQRLALHPSAYPRMEKRLCSDSVAVLV